MPQLLPCIGACVTKLSAGHLYRIMRYKIMGRIGFTATATRQWLKLSPHVRERIDKKLEIFASTGQGDVKKLKGQAGARLRVGDWRVIFYEDAGTITIVAVGHRREIYD